MRWTWVRAWMLSSFPGRLLAAGEFDLGNVAVADVAAADAADLQGRGAQYLEVAGTDAADLDRAADPLQLGVAGADRTDLHVAASVFQFEVARADAADLDIATDAGRLDVARSDCQHLQRSGPDHLQIARTDLARHQAPPLAHPGVAGADRSDLHVAASVFQFEVAGADAADLDIATDAGRLDVARSDCQHLQRSGADHLEIARTDLAGHQAAHVAHPGVAGADIGPGAGATVEEHVSGTDHQLHQDVVRHGAGQVHPDVGLRAQAQQLPVRTARAHHQGVALALLHQLQRGQGLAGRSAGAAGDAVLAGGGSGQAQRVLGGFHAHRAHAV